MTPAQYKDMKTMGQMLHRLRPVALRTGAEDGWRAMRDAMQNVRQDWRRLAMRQSARDKRQDQIISVLQDLGRRNRQNRRQRSGRMFFASIGKPGHIMGNHFSVKTDWIKTVHKPLYEGRIKVDLKTWLVLDMEEYNLKNAPYRLFEAVAWNFKEQKVMTVYVGMTKIGGKALIRLEREDAIKAITTLSKKGMIDYMTQGDEK